ncbi:MAG TPA: type II toxin-antitoxin system HipA family toxin [Kofleriaceae bacterium]|nr:type II toxin-antitoxin system HipA family toxin [Kofleriaceae bacterium]
MKLVHATRLTVYYEPGPGRRVKVGRLALERRRILFEYDATFLGARLELSPYHLRLRPGVFVGNPEVFDGLMGVFEDSLPDGWGRLLMDRRAAELGMPTATLTPLDRLCVVGARSMGALIYEPEIEIDDPEVVKLSDLAQQVELVLDGAGGPDLERLIAVGGSPQGARPKVLIQLAPNGDVHFGARTIEPGFTAWLVKFPARGDDRHCAALEHAYCLMAKAAGIDVPRTQLLGKTRRNPGYFAIERFDRDGPARIHTHTLGGLLHLPLGYPAFDYRDLLLVTRELTRDESAVAEMFRRACFNVFAHNRDDHNRNFAFMMTEEGVWRPSPAYDLSFTQGPGGEHTTLVAGEGRAPGVEHLKTLAAQVNLRRSDEILHEVRTAVRRFAKYADQAGVPARLRDRTARALPLGPR